MSALRNSIYAAMLVSTIPVASAVDLSSYPSSLLGPLANAQASLVKGPVVCKIDGLFYANGAEVNFSGHDRLTHDGLQDGSGFGHFLSPAGKESFVQFSIPYSIPNGDGTFTDGGFTCMHQLDTANSKYAVNKFGMGISELHWQADPNNPQTCPAFVDQIGWLMDKAGHVIGTRINESQTTTKAALRGDCYKGF